MSKKNDFFQINTIFTEGQFLNKSNSQIAIEAAPWIRHYTRGCSQNLEAFNIQLKGKALAPQTKLKLGFTSEIHV